MNSNAKKTGFTLIEIIMAIAITVTIISIVYGSYRATSSSIQACKTKKELSQQAKTAIEQMARQIRCVYAVEDKHVQNTKQLTAQKAKKDKETLNKHRYFYSNPDDFNNEILHIVTTKSVFTALDSKEGLFDVVYKYNVELGVLFISESRFTSNSGNPAERNNWQLFLKNVSDIDMVFFDGQTWTRKWDMNNTTLPLAVRISIAVNDNKHRQHRFTTTAHLYCLNNAQKDKNENNTSI